MIDLETLLIYLSVYILISPILFNYLIINKLRYKVLLFISVVIFLFCLYLIRYKYPINLERAIWPAILGCLPFLYLQSYYSFINLRDYRNYKQKNKLEINQQIELNKINIIQIPNPIIEEINPIIEEANPIIEEIRQKAKLEIEQLPVSPIESNEIIENVNINENIGQSIKENNIKNELENKINESKTEEINNELLIDAQTEQNIIINSPSELFKLDTNNKRSKTERSFDGTNNPYEIDNELIRKVGDLGENFVLQFEIDRIRLLGKQHLIENIKHIPTLYGNVNDFGCDIISFNELEEEIKIEVKTTISGKNTQFYLTDNEFNHLIKESNYFIYRVYEFNIEKQKGEIYIIKDKEELDKYFETNEAKYVAKPRR